MKSVLNLKTTEIPKAAGSDATAAVSAPFFARGVVIEGHDAIHRSRGFGR